MDMLTLPTDISRHLKSIELDVGASFVREGQIAKYIGYVDTGLLRSYQIDHKGEEVTTNFFYTHTYCGAYHSFYQQEPAFETVEALTEVSMRIIGFDTLHRLFEDSLVLNQIGRKTIEQVCIEKDVRLSKLLKLDAKSRYLWFMTTYPTIMQQAPLKHIASYLGMKPESLSRIRKSIS